MPTLTRSQLAALSSMCQVIPTERWVLIGAGALTCHHLPLRRATMDVDFAVSGAAATVHDRLTEAGWERDSRVKQRWYLDGAQVDLIAATQEEVHAGEIHLGDDFVLSVVGFDLAFQEAVSLQVAPGVNIRVPCLSVLVLLKMISWLDRNDREKDLSDIVLMFDAALDDVDDVRFDENHPVGASGVEHEDQGAFFLGWDLGTRASLPHTHWVERFLERMADRESFAFAQFVRASEYGGDDADLRLVGRLHAFELGLRVGMQQRASSLAAPETTSGPSLPVDEAGTRGRPRPATRATPPSRADLAFNRTSRYRSKEQRIHDAIENRRVLRFAYKGHQRVVEPHVLGMKDGRLQVLTWQLGGASSSGPLPDWRTFNVDMTGDLEETGDTFRGSRVAHGRPSPFDRQIAVVR